MGTKALIVWGGWDGHAPEACAKLFERLLRERDFDVRVDTTLDVFTDEDAMKAQDVVIPMWTMGDASGEQEKGICDAVASGVGIAGFHGGMCDAFRNQTQYQFMTGGQFVAHPGGIQPTYAVEVVDHEHPITKGLGDFTMRESEQYYMHVDPSNHVLATTTFDSGCVMPAAWTRTWGDGRVFYFSGGHTEKDFDVTEARELTLRGIEWAARRL